MTDSTISKEEFLKQLGATPAPSAGDEAATALGLTPKGKKRSTSFANKQFQLFTLPVASVYLKGMMPTLPLDCSLAQALSQALVRPLGGAPHRELATHTVTLLREDASKLYSAEGKEMQLDLVNRMISEGLKPIQSKCLSKSNALAVLEEFNAGRKQHLESLGHSTLADYASTQEGTSFEPLDLNNLDW